MKGWRIKGLPDGSICLTYGGNRVHLTPDGSVFVHRPESFLYSPAQPSRRQQPQAALALALALDGKASRNLLKCEAKP